MLDALSWRRQIIRIVEAADCIDTMGQSVEEECSYALRQCGVSAGGVPWLRLQPRGGAIESWM